MHFPKIPWGSEFKEVVKPRVFKYDNKFWRLLKPVFLECKSWSNGS